MKKKFEKRNLIFINRSISGLIVASGVWNIKRVEFSYENIIIILVIVLLLDGLNIYIFNNLIRKYKD